MSPEEIQKAAKLVELEPREFAQTYASHTYNRSGEQEFDETSTWIRLREQGESCVFLGDDGKLCTIYEARPVQCRTYPFWPKVMNTQQAWDDECRRTDEDTDNPLPPWTRQTGGCEGMHTMETSTDGDETGVPLREAYRQLYDYVVSDKRFPKGTGRPVTDSSKPE